MAIEEKCCNGDGDIVENDIDPIEPSSSSIEEMAALFKALGDDRRLTIFNMIAEKPDICACEILSKMDMAQPTLSHHMRILHTSGLVNYYRQGKWHHYNLNPKGVEALKAFSVQMDVPTE